MNLLNIIVLCLIASLAAAAGATDGPKVEPKVAKENYPYVNEKSALSMGEGLGFAVPPWIAFVLLLAGLGLFGFAIFKLMDFHGERKRRQELKKREKEQKKQKKGSAKGSRKAE
jgi:hypothetical protein